MFREASDGSRTHDLFITSKSLYQLSYTGINLTKLYPIVERIANVMGMLPII